MPQHDQKVLGEPRGKNAGGAGGNVACVASRLGLRAGMISWVGGDADGQRVLADLRRFGVDTTHVVVEPEASTNYTIVLVDSTGEKAIIVVPTSFDTLNLDSAVRAYLGQTRLVYSTPYDFDQLARVAAIVHGAGGLVSTDIEPVAGLQDELFKQTLALVDLVFINADSLDTADYEQAAQEIRSSGPELVVITRGAQGALACNDQELSSCPGYAVPVVDTTGAGDCFAGAFLTAYLRRFSLKQALTYANAAAALSIQAHGARGALPTDAQVQAFLTVRRHSA